MKSVFGLFSALTITFILSIATSPLVKAHLMVAQNGTLNIVDEDVYLVLSLPASAFSFADKNADGLLTMVEFNIHRNAINKLVSQNISLSERLKKHSLDGILLSPVISHHDQKLPAAQQAISQLTVMGKFNEVETSRPIQFHVGLYGKDTNTQKLKITATHQVKERKHVFQLSPNQPTMILFNGGSS